MALALPEVLKIGNVSVFWKVHLYYDDESSKFNIATKETTDNRGYFYPIIKNKPTIRQRIDLSKSVAFTSDVTIVCLDNYGSNTANKSFSSGTSVRNRLSSELLYGSRKYINRKVIIEYKFEGHSAVQIFQGRLMGVSHNLETCTLKVQSARAWDFLSVPNARSTSAKVQVPVAYGNFIPSTASPYDKSVSSHESDTQYITDLTNTKLRPIPFNNNDGLSKYYLSEEYNRSVGNRLEIYDKNLDIFIPTIAGDGASEQESLVSNDGQYCAETHSYIMRAMKIRPTSHTTENGTSEGYNNVTTIGTVANSYDTGSGYIDTSQDIDSGLVGTSYAGIDITYNFPIPDGEFMNGRVYLTFRQFWFWCLLVYGGS